MSDPETTARIVPHPPVRPGSVAERVRALVDEFRRELASGEAEGIGPDDLGGDAALLAYLRTEAPRADNPHIRPDPMDRSPVPEPTSGVYLARHDGPWCLSFRADDPPR